MTDEEMEKYVDEHFVILLIIAIYAKLKGNDDGA